MAEEEDSVNGSEGEVVAETVDGPEVKATRRAATKAVAVLGISDPEKVAWLHEEVAAVREWYRAMAETPPRQSPATAERLLKRHLR